MALSFSLIGSSAMSAKPPENDLWQATYDARTRYYETAVGPLPRDILKMVSMFGVWPGGGLFVIPAGKLGKHLSVYTTFGLTNPDMPTTVRITDFQLDSDERNRATQTQGRLERREPTLKKAGASGYGYEIFVVAEKNQEWPLRFLQWAVNAEINHDVGFLARVEKYNGLTVEQIDVGKGIAINVLVAKAQPPLPVGTQLPSGRMELLAATTITDDEMRWSMKNGRGSLLQKLREAGVGQISVLGRRSVVR
jgi:hypothetical protein